MTTLRRVASRVGRFGWYPLMLALAWYLEVYAVGRVELPAGARSLAIVVVIAIVITAACIAILGRERGSMAAVMLLIGLIVVRRPIAALPFIAGDRPVDDRTAMVRSRPDPPSMGRIHEGLTVLVGVLLAIQVVQVATFSAPAPMVASTAWAAQPSPQLIRRTST